MFLRAFGPALRETCGLGKLHFTQRRGVSRKVQSTNRDNYHKTKLTLTKRDPIIDLQCRKKDLRPERSRPSESFSSTRCPTFFEPSTRPWPIARRRYRLRKARSPRRSSSSRTCCASFSRMRSQNTSPPFS